MLYQESEQHIRALWKKLWVLRHRLDEEIFSDGDEAKFSESMMLVAETALRLRTLVQKYPQDSEKLLLRLREDGDLDDVA